MEPIFKYYSFTYKHTNHSIFRGKIKATSEANLNGQLKARLFGRYKREQDISKVVVVEITEEEYNDYL